MTTESERITRKTRIDPHLKAAGWKIIPYTEGIDLSQSNRCALEEFPPPRTEQHEIVRRVGLLFERANAIEQDVAAATKRTEVLTQAVLARAFSGKL
jgi:hypothetical protein